MHAKIWKDDIADNDRQRRKQAEFLVYRFCKWQLIIEIGVLNNVMKARVKEIMDEFPDDVQRVVRVRPDWYY